MKLYKSTVNLSGRSMKEDEEELSTCVLLQGKASLCGIFFFFYYYLEGCGDFARKRTSNREEGTRMWSMLTISLFTETPWAPLAKNMFLSKCQKKNPFYYLCFEVKDFLKSCLGFFFFFTISTEVKLQTMWFYVKTDNPAFLFVYYIKPVGENITRLRIFWTLSAGNGAKLSGVTSNG